MYLASNLEFMPYGTDLEISDNLKILKENSKTFRIIGVPKKINEKPIEEKDTNTKKKIGVTEKESQRDNKVNHVKKRMNIKRENTLFILLPMI